MKKTLLTFSLSLIVALSYAQVDNSTLPSNAGPIQYKPAGFFRAEKFMVNGEQLNRRQVSVLLMNDPASANEFKEYKKNRHIALYAGGASVLFAVGGGIVAPGGFNSSVFANTPSKVFFGLTIGSLVTELVFGTKSFNEFKRSIGLYNHQYQ